jgi:hypothetical protein
MADRDEQPQALDEYDYEAPPEVGPLFRQAMTVVADVDRHPGGSGMERQPVVQRHDPEV